MRDPLVDYAKALDAELTTSSDIFETLAASTGILAAAVADGAHLKAVNRLLRDIIERRSDVTPNVSAGPFVILHSSSWSTWALLLHREPGRSTYLNPTHSISCPVGSSSLIAALHEIDGPVDLSVLDRSVRLRRVWTLENWTAGVLAKDGRTQVLDVLASGEGTAFSLRVNTAAFGAYEWAFDRTTTRPTRVTSISNVDSNLETIFDLLATTRSVASVDAVRPYLEHARHQVRWKAVQTLGRIAPDGALGLVERAAHDEHPHVRAAAIATLARLS